MNILQDKDAPEDAEAGSLQKKTQPLSKLLPLVFCRAVQCGGGWEKGWWWFLLFGGGGRDLCWWWICLSLRDQLSDYTDSGDFSCYVLKENGQCISLLFGQHANKMCIARWKICSAGSYTDADLPVSITMMDSSLTEVSAVSDAWDVVLNGLKHLVPYLKRDTDWAAINQCCCKVDRAGTSQQGAVTSCSVWGSPFNLATLLECYSYRPKRLDVHVHLSHAFS